MIDRVELSGVTFRLPPGWTDVSDELPPGSPPTLARADGIGVIQFSVAKFVSGAAPAMHEADLRSLLSDFATVHELGSPRRVEAGLNASGNRFVHADFTLPEEELSVWYVTNGKETTLLTYITQMPNDARSASERADASRLVASIDFV